MDEALHRRFLEQLRALERFRISYSGSHPGLPLDRADQDIQRLLEAQAFFSARTHRVAEASLTRGTRRLFAQHFPYLLAPTPPAGLIEASLDARFVDPVELPLGESLGAAAEGEDALADTPSPVALTTLAALRLLPLRLARTRFERRRADGPAEIELSFEAVHAHRWPVGPVALHVDHLGDLDASAAVFAALEMSIRRAEVRYGRGEWLRCPLEFGPRPSPRPSRAGLGHPLESARGFFRVPEQDLFFTLRPPDAHAEWSTLTVRLVLSEAWPRGLEPGREALRLHVVPVANLQRELAAPISVDGTRSEHPITHPDALGGFVPHSIEATYRADPEQGLVPLMPGFVPGGGDGSLRWEAELEGAGEARRARLRLAAPEALLDPFRVAVDARWHQPARAARVPTGARVELQERSLEGVSFVARRGLRAAMDARLAVDDDALLGLLAARSRRTLGLSDLRTLLDVLRGPGERAFADVAESLHEVEVRSVPAASSPSGFRYRYRLVSKGENPRELPRWTLFFRRLRSVLEAWSTEEVVELEVVLPRLDRSLRFGGEERKV